MELRLSRSKITLQPASLKLVVIISYKLIAPHFHPQYVLNVFKLSLYGWPGHSDLCHPPPLLFIGMTHSF